ncbi:MAG: extracellular solute-binding protein [Celeribacter sp.]|jgi:microcin C transport system substrate-binding protein
MRPTDRRAAQARAVALSLHERDADRRRQRMLGLSGGLIAAVLLGLSATGLRAQDAAATATPAAAVETPAAAEGQVITAHAFSTFENGIKYPADFAQLDYVNADAPKGGEMAIWARGTFDSMNPYSRKGRAGALSSIGVERLMTSTADDPYGSYCLVCETIEYPESQDWVIFHLRPEAAFSDGTPVTAEDVVFTVDLMLEQALPSFRTAVAKLYESVEAIDAQTVKFTFAEGVPRKGLISQAGSTPIFSKAWYEDTGARLDESRLEPGLTSGPYMLDDLDVNRRIVYKRNPDYWGDDLPINQGRNNFDSIRVEYFADDNAAMEGFKAGAYTFRQETSSLTWATGYDFPKVANGTIVKAELENGELPGATGFVFNLRREKFQDPLVREALGLMFNFTWTNDTLQYGLFKQRSSFWENTDLAATGVPEGAELELLQSVSDMLDPEILTEPAVTAHDSTASQLDRRNFREASRLMQEAGYEVGSDGMLRKDGRTLDITFLEDNQSFDRIIQPYIANLQQLGVNAKYERVDPAQMTNRERDFDFDMIFDFYQNGFEEALGIAQRFGSEDAEYSLFNPAGYGGPAVDALIEKLIDAETLDEMKVAIRAIDRILRHERFIVPVWYNDSYWVAYYDMFEHPDPLPPLDLGHLDFWWYNADKAEELKAKGAL